MHPAIRPLNSALGIPPNRSDLTGILLAGGKSSRMGEDKGLANFRGKPLICYGIELLSMFTDRIIISTGNQEYLQFGNELIPDEVANQGPAAGIAAALKISSTPWNIVLACDIPFIIPELIHSLLSHSTNSKAVVPIHNNIQEPLAALYSKELAEFLSLEVQSGNRALHRILQKCKVNYLDVEQLTTENHLLFTNFNTSEAIGLFS